MVVVVCGAGGGGGGGGGGWRVKHSLGHPTTCILALSRTKSCCICHPLCGRMQDVD